VRHRFTPFLLNSTSPNRGPIHFSLQHFHHLIDRETDHLLRGGNSLNDSRKLATHDWAGKGSAAYEIALLLKNQS
jgi:hypothetical protein